MGKKVCFDLLLGRVDWAAVFGVVRRSGLAILGIGCWSCFGSRWDTIRQPRDHGSLTPKGKEARYFGFFNLSGKATSFLGTFFFGLVVALTGSSRLAIVGLLLFFVVGLLIVAARLKDQKPELPSV